MDPTTRAIALASQWFDERTFNRTFEPLIADWQREWQDTPSRLRWRVSIRGWWAFALAAAVSSPELFRKSVPLAVMNRVATRISVVVGTCSSLMLIPVVLELSRQELPSERRQTAILFFALISAIATSFPFGLAAAVDAIRHSGLSAQTERSAALKLSAFAMVFVLFFGGWIVPAANQGWKKAMAPPGTTTPLLGMRELSTFDLVLDTSRATVYERGSTLASKATSVRRERHNRVAMIVLPIVLIWLRWRAWDLPRNKWARALPSIASTPLTIVAFVAMSYIGFKLERELGWWTGSAFWLPIGAFSLWGVAAPYCRRIIGAIGQESPAG